jgi:poly(3-hydroxybutyrate) depolymerase
MSELPGAAVDLVRRQRRFLDASVLRRNPGPRWTTPNEVVLEQAAFRLRVFGPGDGPAMLLVPPEVNRSYIVDFAPGQSLVQAMLDQGFGRVGVVDWRDARGAAGRRDVDDSLGTILDCAEHLGEPVGEPVHLTGLCQGGWESAMVAALHPEAVRTLTLVAAPIDFHAGDGVLKDVARGMPMAAYASMVAMGHGAIRGDLISTGFDNLLPLERYGLKWLRVWRELDDAEAMERFHRLEDWYRSPKDLPGPMYLRAVRELFKENRLVQGRFMALGRTVDLGAITCPLALVMGTRDHITPPAQTRAAAELVGSEDVLEVEIPAGHVGTFMGQHALTDHWPGLLAWIRGRS